MGVTVDTAAGEKVIVVGAGLSGLATAIGSALQGGLPVVVLEAAELVGGGAAAYSGGQIWCGNNHVAQREGVRPGFAGADRDLLHRGRRGIPPPRCSTGPP